MKICFYTISDLKEYSLKCIDLLLSSINFDIEYDFYIISNISNNNTKYKIINDKYLTDYVGYLKYSPQLPKNYDYYIYLDSDILFFDNLSLLVPMNQEMSIVRESCKISTHDWYYFDKLTNPEDQYKLQKAQAINAGSFSFHRSLLPHLINIYKLYEKYCNINSNILNAKLEQQIYNFIINKYFNFDLNKCYDITDITQLFASKKNITSNKKLYHFCGFTGEMQSKYNTMKEFYDKYKR